MVEQEYLPGQAASRTGSGRAGIDAGGYLFTRWN